MQLPNSHRAIVEREKIAEYLLSDTNPRGQSKAGFFVRFGFNADNWQDLADALVLQGASHSVTSVSETVYGLRYHVDGIIETPDGRNPQIRTVWQFDTGNDYPRLITARPSRRRNNVP